MHKPQRVFAGLAVLALGAGIGSAQNASADRLVMADSGFVTKAAQGGMAEIEMGRLAVQNASSDRVKQFGQRMIEDHSKANEELKRIAAQQGVAVPDSLTAEDEATKERLSKLSGTAFDRAYMQEMVKDHQEDIAEFEREAGGGDDAGVKNFASKSLPTLQAHLKMAQGALSHLPK